MRRILIVSCALAGAVVLVAGCGGKPWSQAMAHATPTARLLSAVQETTAAHTAALTMTVKMTASVSGGPTEKVDVSGKGVIDFTKQNAEITLQTFAAGEQQQVEMRVLAGNGYVHENGEWLRTSASGLSTNGGSVSASGGDPTQYMQYLNGVSSDVNVAGNEVIDGVQTTKYAGTIDVDKLLASKSISDAQREKLRAALELVSGAGPGVPFTAWLDDQGRLRKMNIVFDLTVQTASVHMDETIELSNFGIAVDVQPPPGFGSGTPGSTSAPEESPRAVIQDRVAKSDLRNALTVEKTIYTDDQKYTADLDELSSTEGSLDWGGALHVGVSSDTQTVCLSERSESGATFSIADVATGVNVGTYFGTAPCPSPVTSRGIARLSTSSWEATSSSTSDDDSGDTRLPPPLAQDRAAQSDLRNAMTAEKTFYTDQQTYTDNVGQLRDIEDSLDWGSKPHVVVGNVQPGDKNIVCLWEISSSGSAFSIADVAVGRDAGTFFGTTPCPAKFTPSAFKTAEFNASW